jgi:membrane-bound lytic murein transglycosylase A
MIGPECAWVEIWRAGALRLNDSIRPRATHRGLPGHRSPLRHLTTLAGLLMLTALASCSLLPPTAPPAVPVETPTRDHPPAPPADPTRGDGSTPAEEAPGSASLDRQPLSRGPARWVPVTWSELPGWPQERASELWPALLASCGARPAGWAEFCARALLSPPQDDDQAHAFLATWLAPWRLEDDQGRDEGLATGYFEPVLEASARPREGFEVALHLPPDDLARRQPHWSRQQLDTDEAARDALRGREIAWLRHPLELLLLQIQGSGRLRLQEPDGTTRMIRVAYAGHNGHPYRSVGRWLIERGELPSGGASWPAIRDWADRNPQRVQALMWVNPRVIYFRPEPLTNPDEGPRGAQGVPLTPGRSVAIDPGAVPYGTALWIDTTEPLSTTPLRRLVMAQDTGSAIRGAVRIDYFWGWGDAALAQAGRMRQPLRVWALWPVGATPP